MTTQTRIQLSLQRDSGSIFYQDRHDNLTFHIEALRSTSSSPTTYQSPPAHNTNYKMTTTSSSDQASQASTAFTSDSEHEAERKTASLSAAAAARGDDESEAETDLIKSFLRQHLLKNGEPSRCLIPLMKKDGIEAMLIATVALHLRKDGHGEDRGEGGARDDGAAIRSLHKTLGSLVSVLQQRERVLTYLEENPHVVPRPEAEDK